ncbi:MAG: M16 family metallopeptidase [Variibacter sp.]
MIKRTMAVALAVALSFAVLAKADAAPDGAKPTYFKLANGLEVVVVEDHRSPVVTQMVWYKVGAADEPPGKSGIAHFLEHLMFKGTAKNGPGVFSGTVARLGGQENAFTNQDYTGYYQRVAKKHLRIMMELEADRMTGLTLTEDQVKPELQVVLEEQNQRVANSPAAKLSEQITAMLFLNNPYHKPVIGWRPEIEQLTREDAIAFYRHWYTPNNAVLVVAGDVTPDEVRTMAEETYGKVAARSDIKPRIRPIEPPPIAERHLTLADPQVGQPSLQRSYLVPSDTTAQPGEAEALDLLTHILGNGSVSRLYRELVVDQQLATAVSGYYLSTALDDTRLTFSLTPRAGVSLPQLEEAFDKTLAEAVEKGVTESELKSAKKRMVADMVYARDSQTTLAQMYGAALTTGSTVDKVFTWTDRINAVTAEQVHDVARRYLDKRRSATGYLVQEKSVRAEGKRS